MTNLPSLGRIVYGKSKKKFNFFGGKFYFDNKLLMNSI
ncbi:hypothetical protein BY457_10543 [Marinilabilia salmonicolor]|jgi:hypothetical protein|nr:hypothetical protein BY457_10543 [Marinilabilia salmonicolor]